MTHSYKLVRSRRKSIALTLSLRDGTLTVRAPLRVPLSALERFVDERQAWIETRQKQIRADIESSQRNYDEGEYFRYLGIEYPLVHVDESRKALSFDGEKFVLFRGSRWRAKRLFADWYSSQAKRILTDRTTLFSETWRIPHARIHVRDMKSRWGSCRRDGALSFNVRLVLSPLPVLDSVVAHELAHIVHRDHSPQFWKFASTLCPEIRHHGAWLKKNGHLLVW